MVVLTIHYFLALLLLASGLHKARDWERIHGVITAYQVVPVVLERTMLWLVIGVEIATGAGLALGVKSRIPSFGAAIVFAAYFAVIALNLLRGRRGVDCGCSFSRRTTPLSGLHLVRGALLLMLAVVGASVELKTTIGWPNALQIAAAVVCLALIYLSADTLLGYTRPAVRGGVSI